MAGSLRHISVVNRSPAGKILRSRLVYILGTDQNFLTNGVFCGEGYAAIYLASSNTISQAIDSTDIFILLSGQGSW
jgi:hypothetical protein